MQQQFAQTTRRPVPGITLWPRVVLLFALLSLGLMMFSPITHASSHMAFTNQVSCDGGSNDKIDITYYTEYGGPYLVCFGGSGYLGYQIDGINVISSGWQATNVSWFRLYDSSGGWYDNLEPSRDQIFDPTVLMTQICVDCGWH